MRKFSGSHCLGANYLGAAIFWGGNYPGGICSGVIVLEPYQRLIAVVLSRKKTLEADAKLIQLKGLVGQLKNTDIVNADSTQSVFVLATLGKFKEARLKFSQASVAAL